MSEIAIILLALSPLLVIWLIGVFGRIWDDWLTDSHQDDSIWPRSGYKCYEGQEWERPATNFFAWLLGKE